MLPYITEPDALFAALVDKPIIVDLGSAEEYQQCHIPGAVHLHVGQLRLGLPPAPGLLPDRQQLQQALQSIGINNADANNRHIIAYDHDNNANACRLLWTLEAVSHSGHSVLNGGMRAWVNADLATETIPNSSTVGTIEIKMNPAVSADSEYVLQCLDNPHIKILDARSAAEYHGLVSPSLRKGHIPGAINLNWLDTIDANNSHRFKSPEILIGLLNDKGFSKEKETIVYCQTHQRSSHSFVMLRSLGFNNVRGYAGAWSEWGNHPQLPIA